MEQSRDEVVHISCLEVQWTVEAHTQFLVYSKVLKFLAFDRGESGRGASYKEDDMKTNKGCLGGSVS